MKWFKLKVDFSSTPHCLLLHDGEKVTLYGENDEVPVQEIFKRQHRKVGLEANMTMENVIKRIFTPYEKDQEMADIALEAKKQNHKEALASISAGVVKKKPAAPKKASMQKKPTSPKKKAAAAKRAPSAQDEQAALAALEAQADSMLKALTKQISELMRETEKELKELERLEKKPAAPKKKPKAKAAPATKKAKPRNKTEAPKEEGSFKLSQAGVILSCFKDDKGKLRVGIDAMPKRFHYDWNVQFPRDMRKEGQLYAALGVKEGKGFYRLVGKPMEMRLEDVASVYASWESDGAEVYSTSSAPNLDVADASPILDVADASPILDVVDAGDGPSSSRVRHMLGDRQERPPEEVPLLISAGSPKPLEEFSERSDEAKVPFSEVPPRHPDEVMNDFMEASIRARNVGAQERPPEKPTQQEKEEDWNTITEEKAAAKKGKKAAAKRKKSTAARRAATH